MGPGSEWGVRGSRAPISAKKQGRGSFRGKGRGMGGGDKAREQSQGERGRGLGQDCNGTTMRSWPAIGPRAGWGRWIRMGNRSGLCICACVTRQWEGQNGGRSASKWAERGWVQALRKSRRATARKEGVGGWESGIVGFRMRSELMEQYLGHSGMKRGRGLGLG